MKLAALLALALAAGMPTGLAHAQQPAQLPWTANVSMIVERQDDGLTTLQQLLEHNAAEVPDLDGRSFRL